jgi:hypothetical protein
MLVEEAARERYVRFDGAVWWLAPCFLVFLEVLRRLRHHSVLRVAFGVHARAVALARVCRTWWDGAGCACRLLGDRLHFLLDRFHVRAYKFWMRLQRRLWFRLRLWRWCRDVLGRAESSVRSVIRRPRLFRLLLVSMNSCWPCCRPVSTGYPGGYVGIEVT